MNNDEFEKRLAQHPFRPVPETWKGPILASAREAARRTTWDRPGRAMWAGPWARGWREWLWPHPVAWAVLTALCFVAGMINWSTREPVQRLVRPAPSAPAEAMLILQEQQRRWENLVAVWRGGPRDAAKPDRDSRPGPRSHYYENVPPRAG